LGFVSKKEKSLEDSSLLLCIDTSDSLTLVTEARNGNSNTPILSNLLLSILDFREIENLLFLSDTNLLGLEGPFGLVFVILLFSIV